MSEAVQWRPPSWLKLSLGYNVKKMSKTNFLCNIFVCFAVKSRIKKLFIHQNLVSPLPGCSYSSYLWTKAGKTLLITCHLTEPVIHVFFYLLDANIRSADSSPVSCYTMWLLLNIYQTGVWLMLCKSRQEKQLSKRFFSFKGTSLKVSVCFRSRLHEWGFSY